MPSILQVVVIVIFLLAVLGAGLWIASKDSPKPPKDWQP